MAKVSRADGVTLNLVWGAKFSRALLGGPLLLGGASVSGGEWL